MTAADRLLNQTSMPATSTTSFNLGFTAASLRPELVRIIAEIFLTTGNWSLTKQQVLSTNALQCRSSASAIRMERELRQRLQCLTNEQIVLLARATSDDRALLAWLAAVKQSAFLFDFAAEMLRFKLEIHDPVLRSSDYDRFCEEKGPAHPEIAHLKPSSIAKIRQVMLLMLREVGILHQGDALGRIQRPLLPHAVTDAIRADHSRWLRAFLVPENELIHGS